MNSGIEIIAKLRVEEKNIQDQLEKMRKPILALEEDLKSIQGTIAFYERKANDDAITDMVAQTVLATIPLAKLKGLTHEEAVVAIAKHNGGVVRTQEAKVLMIRAGIMRETKNSTNMAHNAIKRTERFERVAPGEYRLIEDARTTHEVRRVFRMPFEHGGIPQ